MNTEMEERIKQLPQRAKDAKKSTKKYFEKIARQVPKNLDQTIQTLHEEVFAVTDCLKCANCCKTTSPIFRDKDIEKIAHHLGIRPGKFVELYLQMDEEEDYVLRQAPCPFLGADNCCAVYEVRPKACREYPHTDRKQFHQILQLTIKNTAICPAAFEIVERLKQQLP
jgi:Fe-S-cluster containining protein